MLSLTFYGLLPVTCVVILTALHAQNLRFCTGPSADDRWVTVDSLATAAMNPRFARYGAAQHPLQQERVLSEYRTNPNRSTMVCLKWMEAGEPVSLLALAFEAGLADDNLIAHLDGTSRLTAPAVFTHLCHTTPGLRR